MKRRWVVKEAEEKLVGALQSELQLDATLCKLLAQRGLDSSSKVHQFFNPSLEDLYDPFLMKDMDKAIARIEQALVGDERIMVLGDYDVDGTTAVALVFGFFEEIVQDRIEYYIPDRYKEGYGISMQSLEHAKASGISLVIVLDCGIKAVEKVRKAKEMGIDFIICDHHRPGPELPPAVAILDPKRADCTYPFEELSGCGIGFKLIQAFAQKNEIPFHFLEDSLDMVAVSIASDIVPMVDENRVLTHFGLIKLNQNPRPGLKSLVETAGIDRKLGVSDIVFVIGPRINAAGRVDNGKEAVNLLLSKEKYSATQNAYKLESKNLHRRQIDLDITREALDIIAHFQSKHKKKSTVIYQPHWHKGVIGIVASRLIEKYYRPTIILTGSEEVASGSARSIPGFDIYNAIGECSDLLEQFGGHKYAAGLTIKIDNIPEFRKRFEGIVAETLDDDLLIPELKIDAEMDVSKINDRFYSFIERFAPFGPGNMKPVFVSRQLTDTGRSMLVGQERQHIKLHATQEGSYPVDGIGFNMKDKFELLKNETFDVCYTLNWNNHNGIRRLQMQLKDIQ